MARLHKILVGVDLSHGDWLASDELDSSANCAYEQAVELAKAVGGQVHFLATLDLDERTKYLLEHSSSEDDTVLVKAQHALDHLEAAAAERGVATTSSIVLGRARVEIADYARQDRSDLVVIGTRVQGILSGMLLGSTSLELLHSSPSPLWIAKPGAKVPPTKILVATNFSPVCNALLDLGAYVAGLFDAELHLMHVVETSRRPFLQFSGLDPAAVEAELAERAQNARQQIDELLTRPAVKALQTQPTVHLPDGKPSQLIQEQVEALDIDLLLMGTIAWSGVPGLLMGSTAQNLLPHLTCSLLTMRPEVTPES